MSFYQRSGKRPQYCRKSRGPICRHSALAIPRTSCKCCVGKTMLEQLGLESGLGLEEHLSGHWELFAPAWTSFLRLLSWSLKFSEGCCVTMGRGADGLCAPLQSLCGYFCSLSTILVLWPSLWACPTLQLELQSLLVRSQALADCHPQLEGCICFCLLFSPALCES